MAVVCSVLTCPKVLHCTGAMLQRESGGGGGGGEGGGEKEGRVRKWRVNGGEREGEGRL